MEEARNLGRDDDAERRKDTPVGAEAVAAGIPLDSADVLVPMRARPEPKGREESEDALAVASVRVVQGRHVDVLLLDPEEVRHHDGCERESECSSVNDRERPWSRSSTRRGEERRDDAPQTGAEMIV